jgi:hypothetical protein
MNLLIASLVLLGLVDALLAATYVKTSRLLLAVPFWALWLMVLGTNFVRDIGPVSVHLAAIGATLLTCVASTVLGHILRPLTDRFILPHWEQVDSNRLPAPRRPDGAPYRGSLASDRVHERRARPSPRPTGEPTQFPGQAPPPHPPNAEADPRMSTQETTVDNTYDDSQIEEAIIDVLDRLIMNEAETLGYGALEGGDGILSPLDISGRVLERLHQLAPQANGTAQSSPDTGMPSIRSTDR